MKVVLLIWLAFCLPLLSFSQPRAENIKTTKDMDAFLDAYYFKGNRNDTIVDYYTGSVFRNPGNSKAVLHYFDSVNTFHWITMDLNDDKKKDLVWNGCLNGSARVLVFLSNKENYDVKLVSMLSEHETPHVIKPFDRNSFILCRIMPGKFDTSVHFEDRFGIDTITYSHSIFMEYNVARRRYQLDSFKCVLSSGFPTRDSFTICRDNRIYMSRKKYENGIWIMENYYKQMTQDSSELFFFVMNNLPYYSFKKSYSLVGPPPLGGHSFRAQFILDDGIHKELSDYLTSGPYGLRTIFGWLLKLHRDTDWIFINERNISGTIQ
jgi:hypothetical protein